MTYAIPAHTLSAPRPAPISFFDALAEAVSRDASVAADGGGVGAVAHVCALPVSDPAAQTASRGGVANASTQAGEPA